MKRHKLKINGISETEWSLVEFQRSAIRRLMGKGVSGVKLSENGKIKSEVEIRIGRTIQTVGAMRKVYESRAISREAKLQYLKQLQPPN